ncbi:ScbR family autoregulator-binding transcription factor [Streptomyces laurentii]|uniref:ScbR family autoregulator-binding transcription factor n=1 Tax=Streptomyces laurentii TaxID=39478 RepID=UPI00369C1404
MARQERAVRTRNQLIASAAGTFRRRGFAESSLAEIRDEVCVSSGALYFHFENKAALASAVVDEASRILRAAARDGRRKRVPTLQRLIDTTHVLAELLRDNVVAQAGFQLSCTGHGGIGPNLREEWWGCVKQMLAEAEGEGALNPRVSRQDLASLIMATMVGFEMLGRDNPSWLSRLSLTAFWTHQLPVVARPEELTGLNPEGSELAMTSVRRLAQPPRV